MRYRGSKICPDEQENAAGGQPEHIMSSRALAKVQKN